MEKEPILSKWHKGEEISDEKIAEGFISGQIGKGMGIHRKKFETSEGERFYVYKEVLDLKTAQDSMAVYQIFKQAGLPVVGFAKIIKKKVGDRNEFIIAMEDLTANGKLHVTEVSSEDMPDVAFIPFRLKEEMAKTLGIIHNNEIYDCHPGLSFVIRSENQEDGSLRIFDFRIIDYANFESKDQLEKTLKEDPGSIRTFDSECVRDLSVLSAYIAGDKTEAMLLKDVYQEVRKSGNKFFK